MSRDEHGMPLPDERLLPVAIGDCGQVTDRDGEEIELWVDPEFFVHAANWIVPCRDIVRRLADGGTIGDKALMYQLVTDAANLWDEMKGAGDE